MKRKLSVVFALFLAGIILLPPIGFSFQQIPTHHERFKFIPFITGQFEKMNAYHSIAELTKDEYEGRLTGSEGGKKAAQWIADQYAVFGLHTFTDSSYFQTVTNAMSLSNGDNVVGFIPSANPECKKSIVIGAHYDHLGKSISGQIYRGANDNASGTSVVIEMARILSDVILLSSVNIVFVAFTGEEQGLYGSKYYADYPLFPLNQSLAMINLDMVGTGTGNWEIGSNFRNNDPYRRVLKEAIIFCKLKYKDTDWLMKPVSDHYPFYQKGMKVMCLLKENPTNIGGYHTFKDTIESIDANNLDECGKFSLYNVLSLVEEYLTIPMIEKDSEENTFPNPVDVIYQEEEIWKLICHQNGNSS
ncbi:M28 family peptidase [bacterium]|nr:M28 family peptidase [bacterium]